MKFSKEARIGLLVAIAIAVFFAGFYFLKGSSVLNTDDKFYAYYDKVVGLQLSAPVLIKGVGVGKVTEIKLAEDNSRVKVTFQVKGHEFPANTVARLASNDLLTGSKAIVLDLGTSADMAKDEAVLQSSEEAGLVDNISSEISPLLKDVRHAVGTVDSILLSVNTLLNVDTRVRLEHAVASLDRTMGNFESVSNKLNGQSDALAHTIANANSITTNLANNNAQINRILDNLDKTTNGLSRAPIETTVNNLRSVSYGLDTVLRKINNGQGTIGKAMNDPALYNELSGTLGELKVLVDDLQRHPSRYINLTVFGRKAKAAQP